MVKGSFRAAIATAALVASCAPSVPSLVEQRHYREAVCAPADAAERERLDDAIVDDLRPQVHVAAFDVVVRSERLEILRVRVATNRVPLDAQHVEATSRSRALVPVTRDEITARLGPLSPPRRSPWEDVVFGGLAIVTLGASLLAPDAEDPNDERAARWMDVVHHGCNDDGTRCTYDFLPTVPDEDATIELTFSSRSTCGAPPSSTVHATRRLELGRAATLDARLPSMFSGFRAIDEVTSRAGR